MHAEALNRLQTSEAPAFFRALYEGAIPLFGTADSGRAPIQAYNLGGGARAYRVAHGYLGRGTFELRNDRRVCIRFLVGFHLSIIPPPVYCDEKWVHQGTDWHTYSDGGLCWDLPKRWRHHYSIAKDELPPDLAIQHLADWVLVSVHYLLSRHLEAAERGLKKWPDEWSAFRHFEEGERQYTSHRDAYMLALRKELRRIRTASTAATAA